jgi:hypothetical protein
MLVQFTPISSLPPDVRGRLMQYLKAAPMLMDERPIFFEGFHIGAGDVRSMQTSLKTQGSQPLFG